MIQNSVLNISTSNKVCSTIVLTQTFLIIFYTVFYYLFSEINSIFLELFVWMCVCVFDKFVCAFFYAVVCFTLVPTVFTIKLQYNSMIS